MTFEEVPLELGGAAVDWQGDPDDNFQRSPLKSPSPTWSSRNAWSSWRQTNQSTGWDTVTPNDWRQENQDETDVICLDDVPPPRAKTVPQRGRPYIPAKPDCYSWAKVNFNTLFLLTLI